MVRSAAAGSAIAARLPPTAAARAFRSSEPATGTTATVSAPSTSATRVLNTRSGRDAQRLGRLLAVGGGGRVVLVGVHGERHARRGQRRPSRACRPDCCFFGFFAMPIRGVPVASVEARRAARQVRRRAATEDYG